MILFENNLDMESYILEHSGEESVVLKELERETHLKVYNSRMISGHLQGRILKMLSGMVQPHSVLEIGALTGYSAICLAEGLVPGGKVHTIEIDDELEEFVRRFLRKSGFENKVNLHIGDALDIIPRFEQLFDLAFIDGDKRQYLDYYKLVIDKVRTGGYIIADNVLWGGKVIDPAQESDEQTKAIREFNAFVQMDTRVENVIFPVRDGMMLIHKIV